MAHDAEQPAGPDADAPSGHPSADHERAGDPDEPVGKDRDRAATTARRSDRRPSRRTLSLIVAPLIALVVATNVGSATAPSLVDTHPAWLIALNPGNRNLVLVTNALDALTYYSIGAARLVVADPLFFLLGLWYGDAAVSWMERRTRTWGTTLRKLEHYFGKAGYPLIFLAPNQYICLFAGASGVPVAAFFALNIAGTLTRLYLIRRFGDIFESPIDGIVDWIGDNRAPLLVASIGLVVLSIAMEARRGETEVSSLTHLDDELGTADEQRPDTPADDGSDPPPEDVQPADGEPGGQESADEPADRRP